MHIGSKSLKGNGRFISQTAEVGSLPSEKLLVSTIVSIVLHGLALVLFEPETINSADTTLFVTLVDNPVSPTSLPDKKFTDLPNPVASGFSKDQELAVQAATEPQPTAPEILPKQTIALPFQEIFYKSSELDEQPYPLKPVNPYRPEKEQGTTGWVRLLLLIDNSGKLVQSSVISSDAPESFHEAALSAFLDIPFSPGKRAGKAVNSRMVIKVSFDNNIQ